MSESEPESVDNTVPDEQPSVPENSQLAPSGTGYRAGDFLIIAAILVAVAGVFWYDISVKEERAQNELRATYREHMTNAIRQFFLITGAIPQSAEQVVSINSFRTGEITQAVRKLQGDNYSSDEEMLTAMEARAFADATPIDDETLVKWKLKEKEIVQAITSVETELQRLQLAINPEIELIASLRVISVLSRNGIADQKLDAYLAAAIKVRKLMETEETDAELNQSLIDGVYSSADISNELQGALKEFHTQTGFILRDMTELARRRSRQAPPAQGDVQPDPESNQ